MQPLCEGHHVRHGLSVGLADLDLLAGGAITIASRLQLADEPGLLELSERAGDLARGNFERIFGVGEVVTACRENPNVSANQKPKGGGG
jgi:hypothetical protein